jgi:excisionase family DNA binding protein
MADMMDALKDRYIPMTAVADVLACTERHVYDLVTEGKLKAIKVGSRAIRISEQSLCDFIKNNTVNPEDLFDPDREEKTADAPQRPTARSRWMTK